MFSLIRETGSRRRWDVILFETLSDCFLVNFCLKSIRIEKNLFTSLFGQLSTVTKDVFVSKDPLRPGQIACNKLANLLPTESSLVSK